MRYDQEALVFWVVFGLVLGALVLGFCFGLAARDLRREARARRRADKESVRPLGDLPTPCTGRRGA